MKNVQTRPMSPMSKCPHDIAQGLQHWMHREIGIWQFHHRAHGLNPSDRCWHWQQCDGSVTAKRPWRSAPPHPEKPDGTWWNYIMKLLWYHRKACCICCLLPFSSCLGFLRISSDFPNPIPRWSISAHRIACFLETRYGTPCMHCFSLFPFIESGLYPHTCSIFYCSTPRVSPSCYCALLKLCSTTAKQLFSAPSQSREQPSIDQEVLQVVVDPSHARRSGARPLATEPAMVQWAEWVE